MAEVPASRTRSSTNRSPAPGRMLASTTSTTTSTSRKVSVAALDHAPIHPVHRLVDAGSVDEHNLPARRVSDTENPMARRLRLIRDDRELLSGEPIEQRGLAGVGPAHDGQRARSSLRGFRSGGLLTPDPDLVNPAAFRLEHLDAETVGLEPLTDERHPPRPREHEPTRPSRTRRRRSPRPGGRPARRWPPSH